MVNLTLTELDPLTATQSKIRRADILTPLQEAEAAINALGSLAAGELASDAAQIDLTGIPQTGSIFDLYLRLRATPAVTSVNLQVGINGDGTAAHFNNLSYDIASGGIQNLDTNAANYAYMKCLIGAPAGSAPSGLWANWHIRIFDYADATAEYKNILGDGLMMRALSATNMHRMIIAGNWSSGTTDPITQVTITPGSGNWLAGSRYAYRLLGAAA